MLNDLDKLLEKVVGPIKKLEFYQSREFRIKFIKISGIVFLILISSLFIVNRWSGEGESNKKILKKISEFMVLPDEEPTLAAVTDVEPIKNNLFFKGANKGDKLFLYKNSGKVILYSIKLNRILNVGSMDEAKIRLKN